MRFRTEWGCVEIYAETEADRNILESLYVALPTEAEDAHTIGEVETTTMLPQGTIYGIRILR